MPVRARQCVYTYIHMGMIRQMDRQTVTGSIYMPVRARQHIYIYIYIYIYSHGYDKTDGQAHYTCNSMLVLTLVACILCPRTQSVALHADLQVRICIFMTRSAYAMYVEMHIFMTRSAYVEYKKMHIFMTRSVYPLYAEMHDHAEETQCVNT